jgi:hypothetical protein
MVAREGTYFWVAWGFSGVLQHQAAVVSTSLSEGGVVRNPVFYLAIELGRLVAFTVCATVARRDGERNELKP